MQNQYTHENTINYELNISTTGASIFINLHSSDFFKFRTFSNSFTHDTLPSQLKNTLGSIENVYNYLQKSKNFELDPIRGMIDFFHRTVEDN